MILLSAIFALVIIAIPSQAQDYSKSSKEWNRKTFKKVETVKEIEDLPKETEIAMACPKCKSVTILVKKELATKPGHGTVEESLTVDPCPGCGGKITTKHSGKETIMVHTCNKCGDESPYCCATKPKEKTEGMSKD